MMIQALIKKEWLKLRYMILAASLLTVMSLAHFVYNLNFSFQTVEPESMMWYRFAYLNQKPYDYLCYVILAIAFAISLFQFIPERVNHRIKIITHLPLDLRVNLIMHLAIGLFFTLMIALLILCTLIITAYIYYPPDVIMIIIKDCAFYFLCAMILYLGVSATLLEFRKKRATFKFILTLFVVFIFLKDRYEAIDLLWLFVAMCFFVVVLDSFYSIKNKRVNAFVLNGSMLLCLLVLSFFASFQYSNTYKFELNKYYIFYSPVKKVFVYQKNFGNHRYEYGIKAQETFDMKTYQSYLPFVYWRDLDIQNRLPVIIDSKPFTKQQIKDSRLSFSYEPSDLKRNEVQLHPLINPNSKRGRIRFPEEMLAIKNDQIKIYNYDDKLDVTLTQILNDKLKEKSLSFPIQNVWGKATNMKPYDLGYFLQDAQHNLFRINRLDNELFVQHLEAPKDLVHMKISENKQQKLAGFAITKNSAFYLLDYQNLTFKQLKLKDFDHQKMKLKFIANPKYYLIRYDDGNNYYAIVFDKQFNKIKEEVFN